MDIDQILHKTFITENEDELNFSFGTPNNRHQEESDNYSQQSFTARHS